MSEWRRTVETVVLTLVVSLLLAGGAAATYVYLGLYNIAAISPHDPLAWMFLDYATERAIKGQVGEVEVPALDDARLIRRGLALYQDQCVVCHGAPGWDRSHIGVGVNPNPPPLETAVDYWTPAEIHWITTNGVKMTGMPGFGLTEPPEDLWALTAFVVRMNTVNPAEYRRMIAAVEGTLPPGEEVVWVAPEGGWAKLQSADPERGRFLIRGYGCGTCHDIPGVVGADGTVGPPLRAWSERHYIAGQLVNIPDELVRWIVDPQAVEPGTDMLDLGVREDEAWDMAGYLYTLD